MQGIFRAWAGQLTQMGYVHRLPTRKGSPLRIDTKNTKYFKRAKDRCNETVGRARCIHRLLEDEWIQPGERWGRILRSWGRRLGKRWYQILIHEICPKNHQMRKSKAQI